MLRITALILLLFFGAANDICSQQNYVAQTHTIGIDDGLLSNNISAVFEDSKGIIWIGTDYGLHAYDGISIKAYTQKKHGLLGNYINSITEDQHGNLWVHCSAQLMDFPKCCIFDPLAERAVPVSEYCVAEPNFEQLEIKAILKNQDKSLWLISQAFKVYEYDGTQIRFITNLDPQKKYKNQGSWKKMEDHLVGFSAYEKATETSGNYFILYDYKKKEILEKIILEHNEEEAFLYQDKDKTIYVKVGSLRSDGRLALFKRKEGGVFEKKVLVEQEGNKGRFVNGELVVDVNREIRYYTLDGDLIKKIPLTNDFYFGGNYWTDDHGGFWFFDSDAHKLRYIRYQPSFFRTYQLNQNNPTLYYKGGRGITVANDSVLYIGGVVDFFDVNSPKLKIKSLGGGAAGLLDDRAGTLYCSCYGDGILTLDYDKNELIRYHYETASLRSIEWTLNQDKEGKIWVGTTCGLFYLDTIHHKIIEAKGYNDFEELQKSTIYAIYEEGEDLWLGTSTGLYRWNKQKGAEVRYHSQGQGENYLPFDIIAHIHKDATGDFWLATKGGGLLQFNPKTKKHQQFTTREGLSHNVLYAVYEDAQAQLWLSSNRGIMCFNKETQLVTNYTSENGLLDDEFNTASHYQDEKGQIYFGSQQGLVVFDPNDMDEAETDTFPILTTQVFVQHREDDVYRSILSSFRKNHQITLNPSDKGFKLTVSLLDYRNPKRHQYAYLIEGVNKDWIYQSRAEIKENNLPYGQYNLRVKIKGVSGKWLELEQPIEILVLRPFYLRWWFILVVSILVIVVLFGMTYWRTQRLLERQRELEAIVEKRTAKIAQQTEDLKALDKVKSKFFANISHELRTPLTLILGPLSYILDTPDAWEEAEVRAQLKTMQRNGKSLLQLIEEILDLSKLEAQKLELNEISTPVKSFFQKVYTVFEPQFDALEIHHRLQFDVQEDNLTLLLDRNKMEKVFNNFLSNAIKFTPKGGWVEVDVSTTENQLQLKVKDNGKGIHPKDLPFVFERYYQSKQADAALYGGTGIGLALVREFATLMQGKAYVESVLGTGSSFYFELPKKVVEPIAIEKERGAINDLLEEELIESVGTDFRILIVEDNDDMRNFIQVLLQKRYQVISARNGLEGLEQIKRHKDQLHLVISDVMMPEMDGLTMLKAIKSNEMSRALPVIMLTALAAERDKLNALLIGVDDYLTKPFLVNELMVRVQNLLYNYHQRKLTRDSEAVAIGQSPEEKEPESKISEEDQQWVKAIEDAVKTSISNQQLITVDALSKAFYLSERQFGRRLKLITGLSPAKFIKEVQLQIARQLLEKGNVISISEVAYDAGFEVRDTFTRLYKKRFGKMPKDYLT